MAAAELDIKAAAVRHNDLIDRPNAVHLFSDNWPVRRWTSAWVAEQKTTEPPDSFFEVLECASDEELASALGTGPAELDTTGRAVCMGSISRGDFDSLETLHRAVIELASVYPGLSREFSVPYLEVQT